MARPIAHYADVDALIVGGGPAGAATALSLSQNRFSVIVCEQRSSGGRVPIGETLPPEVRGPLQRLGVWERFCRSGHVRSVATKAAWESNDLYDNDFITNPYGHGWHVDRSQFDSMLVAAAREVGSEILFGARLVYCERAKRGGWRAIVRLAAGGGDRAVQARVLVDATGRSAHLAKQKGGARRVRVPGDTLVGAIAFCTPLRRVAPDGGHTLLEAVEGGWWYSAVLGDDRLVLTFVTDADLCAHDQQRTPSWFLEKLASAFYTSKRAVRHAPPSIPRIVAAGCSMMVPAAAEHWVTVGDSASTFDPLSSQGICKALEDGMMATDAIASALSGSNQALRCYSDYVKTRFEEHLRVRHNYYSQVRRFSGFPFWQRRQAGSARDATAITVSPGDVLELGLDIQHLRSASRGFTSPIDLECLLQPLMAGPLTAFALAVAYKRSATVRTFDHALLACLSDLQRRGILRTLAISSRSQVPQGSPGS